MATTGSHLFTVRRPTATRRHSTPFAGGLADPTGLAFDDEGHLFVADGSAGRVLKLHAPAAPVFGAVPP